MEVLLGLADEELGRLLVLAYSGAGPMILRISGVSSPCVEVVTSDIRLAELISLPRIAPRRSVVSGVERDTLHFPLRELVLILALEVVRVLDMDIGPESP